MNLKSIKPTFYLSHQIFTPTAIWLYICAFAVMYLPVGVLLSLFYGTGSHLILYVPIATVPLIVLISLLYLKFVKSAYGRLEYGINEERITFVHGIFNLRRKVILLSDIIGCDMSSSFMQYKYGLGTIILSSAAESFELIDIKNPEAIFDEIQKLIEKCKKSNL